MMEFFQIVFAALAIIFGIKFGIATRTINRKTLELKEAEALNQTFLKPRSALMLLVMRLKMLAVNCTDDELQRFSEFQYPTTLTPDEKGKLRLQAFTLLSSEHRLREDIHGPTLRILQDLLGSPTDQIPAAAGIVLGGDMYLPGRSVVFESLIFQFTAHESHPVEALRGLELEDDFLERVRTHAQKFEVHDEDLMRLAQWAVAHKK